jgi:hypothetical protein
VAPLPSIKANRLQSEVLLATTAQIRQCHLMVWAFFIIFGLFMLILSSKEILNIIGLPILQYLTPKMV